MKYTFKLVDFGEKVKTDPLSPITKIIEVIEGIEFNYKIQDKNRGQKVRNTLHDSLERSNMTRLYQWEKESKRESSNDLIDISGKCQIGNKMYSIIIEVDSWRADQIAKKFLSRIATNKNDHIIYFTFCYHGSEGQNLNETKKYMKYALELSTRLNNNPNSLIYYAVLPKTKNGR